MRGVTLEPGSVVILALDGTMVFVEDIQSTFAAVVAFPEQPPARPNDARVFTPGRVGVKKISPFSGADRVVPRDQLSPRNTFFLNNYEDLRGKHGPNYVQRTPEEEAAMTVEKAGPVREPRERGKGKRAQKRAALAKLQLKCQICGLQRAHFDHPSKHEFVPPAESVTDVAQEPAEPKAPRASKVKTLGGVFTLTSTDLTAARAQKRGDKYNEGNRSFRVVEALRKLPGSAGTFDDILSAVVTDGGKPMTNPQKVVRRTLSQLATPDFGNVVSKS